MIFRETIMLGVYLAFVFLPLIVGLVLDPIAEPRAFLTELSVAFGYVGLSIMAIEFVLISRIHSVTGVFGQDKLLKFHRRMGLLSFVLIAGHPVLLVFGSSLPWSWAWNPLSDAPWGIRFGTIALLALAVLIVTSLFRRWFRLSYEWWDVIHRFGAAVAVVLGLYHTVSVGTYAALPAMRFVWIVYLLILGSLAIRYRIVVPIFLLRRPWQVTHVKKEWGDSITLEVRPKGHPGFSFQPGQFAWVVTGRSPFSSQRHPISFSSCGDVEPGGAVSFTIKNLGDWSGRVVPSLRVDDVVWLDGPYGVFTIDRYEAPGYVLIGGGVGITPLKSMIETMRARKDVRPILLFYGSKSWEETTFRDELLGLEREWPSLKIVTVLEEPPQGWMGEVGLITKEILRKNLPGEYKRFRYFVCGPIPLMDVMERFLPELGVPSERIHTERFDIV